MNKIRSDPGNEAGLRPWAGVSLCALLACVVAYLGFFGRAGVGIEIFGLPIGAYLTPMPSVIVSAFFISGRGRAHFFTLDWATRRAYYTVAFAVCVALLRGLAQGNVSLLQFRDMAYVLHLSWVAVAMLAATTASTRQLQSLVRVVTWTILVVLFLHVSSPWIGAVDRVLSWLSRIAERAGSDKPEILLGSGDLVVLSLSFAALALNAQPRRISPIPVLAAAFLGVMSTWMPIAKSRGSAIGLIVGISCLVLLRQNRARLHRGLVTVFVAAAVVFAIGLLANSSYEEIAGRRTIAESVADISGDPGREWNPTGSTRFVGREWNPTGTIGWRIYIWRDVINEWNETWATRLFGIGFGNDLRAMMVPGRQGYDGTNRSPHSIAISILGRQGLLGIAAFAAVIVNLLRINPASSAVVTVTASIVIGLFDSFLESAHSPILTWVLVGLLLGLSASGTFMQPRSPE